MRATQRGAARACEALLVLIESSPEGRRAVSEGVETRCKTS